MDLEGCLPKLVMNVPISLRKIVRLDLEFLGRVELENGTFRKGFQIIFYLDSENLAGGMGLTGS